jgi:membrane protein DedA with SNARE-associated domain
MLEWMLGFYQASPGLALVVLGLAAAVEYVFPPFPGDTIAVLGAFLASAGGGGGVPIMLVTLVGTAAGAMADFYFGRWLHAREGGMSKRAQAAIDGLVEKFKRHGEVYLVLNRFLPGIRAFFFVAAGVAGMRPGRVLLFSLVSGFLWNCLLVGVGLAAGRNLERLQTIFSVYQNVVLGVIAAVGIAYLLRRLLRARREG